MIGKLSTIRFLAGDPCNRHGRGAVADMRRVDEGDVKPWTEQELARNQVDVQNASRKITEPNLTN
jgi:hypothetical protein